MKRALLLAITASSVWLASGSVAQNQAQNGEPNVPIELRDMTQSDPKAKQYEPVDAPGIDAMVIKAALAKPEESCLDLTAEPRPLPNGNDQYPTKACVDMDYTQSYAEELANRVVPPAAKAPMGNGTPIQAGQATAAPMEADGMQGSMNGLQMQRLGQLDAMQGRPVNMQNASVLGYMQGYVQGQQMRTQTLPGRGRGGNFGGFGQ